MKMIALKLSLVVFAMSFTALPTLAAKRSPGVYDDRVYIEFAKARRRSEDPAYVCRKAGGRLSWQRNIYGDRVCHIPDRVYRRWCKRQGGKFTRYNNEYSTRIGNQICMKNGRIILLHP